MPAPNKESIGYIVGFAAIICLVCAIVVATAAVALRPLQEINAVVDRQTKVLEVAGLVKPGESLSAEEIGERFDKYVVPKVVNLSTGRYESSIDAKTYDQRRAAKDPEQSAPAPKNDARVLRLPKHAQVYHVLKDGHLEAIILPIQGYGLWSTMYGYLALKDDAQTVAGITFYEHGETPGLGGEVENPRWQALWPGRKAFSDDGQVKLEVIKGNAGPAAQDPYRIDGLSGATITSRGVTHTLSFWLGHDAFGPYLENYRRERSAL